MEVLTCSAQKVWTDQPRLTPHTYRVVLNDFVYVKCFFRGIVDVQFSIVLTTNTRPMSQMSSCLAGVSFIHLNLHSSYPFIFVLHVKI